MKPLTEKDKTALLTHMDSAGIFVTCGKKTPNVMVTHIGTLGKLWGRDVFFLPVRSNKYSYKIVSETKSFALNVPSHDMRREIALCDTISGFKYNKFETLGLHAKPSRTVDTYILGECGLIVECNVIAKIPPENITAFTEIFDTAKAHTLFVGEIVDSYRLR